MIDVRLFGHACIQLRGAAGALVCDPWLSTIPIYANSAIKYPFMPAELLPAALDASHVYVSHHHEDHFNVPTLDLLRRDVTLLIPAFERSAHERAHSMARTLHRLGFRNVVRLRSWQSIDIELGETVRLTLVPSALSRWHDWENSGLIMQTGAWTGVNLNDNIADAELLAQVRERAPRVDVAFVQGFSSTEFPGAFEMPPREKISLGRRKRGSIEEARKVIEALAPRRVVPIASDIAWYRPDDLIRNYSDKTTPSRFGKLLSSQGLLRACELSELYAGDTLDPASGAVARGFGELNFAGFRRRLRRKAESFHALARYYDSYQERRVFDAAGYDAFLARFAAYLPREVPLPADGEIHFIIVGESRRALRRFALRGAGCSVSVVDKSAGDTRCDQEIEIPLPVWSECAGGRMLRRDIIGTCLNRQLLPFRFDIAVLRYLFALYSDLGDISPWVRVAELDAGDANLPMMRHIESALAPRFPAADLRDEYQRPAGAG